MGLLTKLIKGGFKGLFRVGSKSIVWLAPLLKWIPSKLNILITILLSYAKTIILLFFLFTIFTPVFSALTDTETNPYEKAFAVFNGVGETIATPDMAIATNIAVLKAAETDDSISTIKPYSSLFRSSLELLAVFVVGFMFVAFINTNMSTKYGIGTFIIVGILYSITVMHYTGELPFYGLVWSDDSLLRNLDVFLNPIEPAYELYNYMRSRFSSLDIGLMT